jgi:radical SAM superfamily enzyme YgiQ (UPF0313 family)
MGVDSGCQTILDKNKRLMDVFTMKRAFEKAREYGISTRAYVTFGLPGETNQSPQETVRFLREVEPDQILLSLATAYPGTELWNGRSIEVHTNWVSKFHGHGRGGKLFLSKGLSKKDYIKLADLMYGELKKLSNRKMIK